MTEKFFRTMDKFLGLVMVAGTPVLATFLITNWQWS